MNRKMLGNAALYSIGEIIPKAVRILLLPVFTRYLLPEEYGILAYTSSVVAFLFVLSILSLNTYIIRFYFDFDPDDEMSRRKLIGNVFVFMLIFNSAMTAVALIIGPWVVAYYGVDVPFYPYFILALLGNFFNVLSVVPMAVYRIKKQAGIFIVLSVSRAVLQTVVALVLVVGFEVGVIGVYWSVVGVGAAYAWVYFVVIYRHGIFTLDVAQIRRALAFSLPIIPAAMSHLVIDLADRIMLESRVTLDRLGLYSVAYTLGFGMTVVIQGGYKAFEPELFQAHGTKGFVGVYDRIKRTFLFVVMVAGAGLALFSPELLLVMTSPRFHDASGIVPIVVLAACLRAVGMLFSIMLIASKHTVLSTVVVVLGAVVNVSTNLVLIPTFGIVGAAWSTVAAFAVMAPLAYLFCERLGILRVRGLLVRDLLAFIVVGVTVWWFVYSWIPAGVGLAVAVKAGVWLVLAGLLGLIYGIWRDVARTIVIFGHRK